MADRKITGHTALTAANAAVGDLIEIVDISDPTDAASGTNKKMTVTELRKLVGSNIIEFAISGGGFAITTGGIWMNIAKFAGTINSVTMYSDVSTSTVVDIWKTTYADYDGGATHPVNGDSITASAPPTITTALKSTDATLTGWTTSFAKGDILWLNVDSNDNATKLTIVLDVTAS
jgi:hypothetical protein